MHESLAAFHRREQFWRDHFANGLPAYVRRVLNRVEEQTGVTVAEMRKPGRATVAGARAMQLAIVTLRAETRLTQMAIAAIFNKRSHVTINRLLNRTIRKEL